MIGFGALAISAHSRRGRTMVMPPEARSGARPVGQLTLCVSRSAIGFTVIVFKVSPRALITDFIGIDSTGWLRLHRRGRDPRRDAPDKVTWPVISLISRSAPGVQYQTRPQHKGLTPDEAGAPLTPGDGAGYRDRPALRHRVPGPVGDGASPCSEFAAVGCPTGRCRSPRSALPLPVIAGLATEPIRFGGNTEQLRSVRARRCRAPALAGCG